MPAGQSQTSERGGVGAQLVGDDKFWRETLLLEQLASAAAPPGCPADAEPACREPRPVVDGTPEIHPLAGDPPHRFVGDVEPSFGQELLDIAIAQSEAEIEPHRVLDDLGREARAVAERSHVNILPDMR